jgi:hypothetical protein
MVAFLALMLAANIHFVRQEDALRAEVRRAVAADRAKDEMNARPHIVLDCVEIHRTQ